MRLLRRMGTITIMVRPVFLWLMRSMLMPTKISQTIHPLIRRRRSSIITIVRQR